LKKQTLVETRHYHMSGSRVETETRPLSSHGSTAFQRVQSRLRVQRAAHRRQETPPALALIRVLFGGERVVPVAPLPPRALDDNLALADETTLVLEETAGAQQQHLRVAALDGGAEQTEGRGLTSALAGGFGALSAPAAAFVPRGGRASVCAPRVRRLVGVGDGFEAPDGARVVSVVAEFTQAAERSGFVRAYSLASLVVAPRFIFDVLTFLSRCVYAYAFGQNTDD
jgi:hypothetical protein